MSAAHGSTGKLADVSDSASPRAAAFERARQETIRYHEELYAQADLGVEGTWLAKPHRLVFDAFTLKLEFVDDVDLVFAFSSVEHLADAGQIRQLFRRMRSALVPGGVVALGIVADRYEVDTSGSRRPALLESGISVTEVNDLLSDSFAGFEVIGRDARRAAVREQRDGEEYLMSLTLTEPEDNARTGGPEHAICSSGSCGLLPF